MTEQPAWEETPAGLVLPVLAHPGARQPGVKGVRDRRLIVAVAQAPEKGKANDALIEALAAALGIKRRQITLLTGDTNPRKRFLIRAADLATLSARVAELLAPSEPDA